MEAERIPPKEDLKKVQIGSQIYHVTNISTLLYTKEEHELVEKLINNIDLFTWAPFDMPGIDTKVVGIASPSTFLSSHWHKASEK